MCSSEGMHFMESNREEMCSSEGMHFMESNREEMCSSEGMHFILQMESNRENVQQWRNALYSSDGKQQRENADGSITCSPSWTVRWISKVMLLNILWWTWLCIGNRHTLRPQFQPVANEPESAHNLCSWKFGNSNIMFVCRAKRAPESPHIFLLDQPTNRRLHRSECMELVLVSFTLNLNESQTQDYTH